MISLIKMKLRNIVTHILKLNEHTFEKIQKKY